MSISRHRTATGLDGADMFLRFSIGLEAEHDLMRDIEAFFARLEELRPLPSPQLARTGA